MPLRDHFRPPVDNIASWDVVHAMWPSAIVRELRTNLPEGFIAGPGVHIGTRAEVDIAAWESDDSTRLMSSGQNRGGQAAMLDIEPSVDVETMLPDFDEYQVSIYDVRKGRQLVAVIEIVSPGNKDRPEARNAFIGKCAALLQKGVAVSIIDIVTVKQFNLYAELMEFVGQPDPKLNLNPAAIYASSCRWITRGKRHFLQAWYYPLSTGQPLPQLPLWLAEELGLMLNVERTYEQTCHDLWIP